MEKITRELREFLPNKEVLVKGFSLLIFSTTFNSALGSDYTDTPEYKYEKECIGTLSYARDYTFDSDKQEAYRSLTSLQNDFYLKRPWGYFPSMHITAWKLMVKMRTEEKGISYLNSTLRECGWTGDLG
jgi:hypothetical protein